MNDKGYQELKKLKMEKEYMQEYIEEVENVINNEEREKIKNSAQPQIEKLETKKRQKLKKDKINLRLSQGLKKIQKNTAYVKRVQQLLKKKKYYIRKNRWNF